jgi:outer membrane protein assembly factor BamB
MAAIPIRQGQRFLRALNIDTGEIVWEVPQPGAARAKTWSGVLATAGGLIFYGQPNGGFAAVDQRNGKTLWRFPTNIFMKASPMTFMVAASSMWSWRRVRIFFASASTYPRQI